VDTSKIQEKEEGKKKEAGRNFQFGFRREASHAGCSN
jgi:hypothetical protein